MKFYNSQFIKQFCEQNKDKIDSVDIGMQEDWSWTHVTVFFNGHMARGLDWNADRIEVQGISGSTWATPIMVVFYKDGHHDEIECWTSDGKEAPKEQIERQKAFAAATGGCDWRV